MTTVAFLAVCAVLLLVPFVPAWREWRRPTDAQPLPVDHDRDHDPFFLAKRFREELGRMRAIGPSAGYQPVDEVDELDDDAATRRRQPILACAPVRTVGAVATLRPLYAMADLQFGPGAVFAQVMSEGRIDLGPGSRIAGWAHAECGLRLGERSVATRRVSSARVVKLERGCCFERVHAPTVLFGGQGYDIPPREQPRPARSVGELAGAVERTPGVWRCEGDLYLPDGDCFKGTLIATGIVTLGKETRLEGSLKAHRGVVLGEGAQVTGSLTCENGIELGAGSEVGGPLVGETHIVLGAGSRVGRPSRPTSANADAIIAEPGAVAHGTVWAQRAGVVWGGAA